MTEDLRADDGTVVATYFTDRTGDVDWAVVTALRPAAEVAPAVLARLGGHRVVTEDDDLVALLVAAGGVVQRRAHDYEYDLAHVPREWAETPVPQGFRLSPEFDTERLAVAHAAAYPPGHVDAGLTANHAREMYGMARGEIVGPLVPGASWQLDTDDGTPCGAVFNVDRADATHPGRTWIIDVFVDPAYGGRGLGGLLLRRSLAGAAAAGRRTTGLVVTDANPAERVYRALGFRHTRSGTNVDLPTSRR